jgi:hypothetical protein
MRFQDRAAVIASAICRIIADTRGPKERHRHIEALLREEIADIAREIAADRSNPDA